MSTKIVVTTEADTRTVIERVAVEPQVIVTAAVQGPPGRDGTNTVNSVAGKQGVVLLDKEDVGLGAVDNTSDADKPVSTSVADALDDKVDKVIGKQLSDENFTQVEKDKLAGIALEATKNRSDSENADKEHTHTMGQVTGLDDALDNKVDKQAGKQLSDENFTQAEKTKLSGIASEATKNRADSENADKEHTHTTAQVVGLDDALTNKVDKVAGKGLIEPAPTDGKQYARKDNTWVEVTGGGTGDVEEAPIDGKQYARKNAGWVESIAGSGMFSLSFDQEVLLLAGREFPLFDDFPDPTKNYKGYVYNATSGRSFPYTATYLPEYQGIEDIVAVEVFPDINDRYHFSYLSLMFGAEVAVQPIAATPFYSVSTSTGLPSGVTSLRIFYQLEDYYSLSIAGINAFLSPGNKGIPISIDLFSLTAKFTDVYGMPIEFFPVPFEPEFGDPFGGSSLKGFGVLGITENGARYEAYMGSNGLLVLTSDNDLAHSLSIEIPVTRRAATWS